MIDSVSMKHVAAHVPRWLEEIPLYQKLANGRRCRGEKMDFADCFQSLPLITKQDIRREFPRNFLRADVDLQDLIDRDVVELERTSGTSEEATPLLLGRGWWNQQEQKALRLNPWVDHTLTLDARRATIVSPMCSSEICYTGTPTREDRTLGGALFVNLSRHPFLWSEAALNRMVREVVKWQPDFLDVDPVYGVLFARYCQRHGIHLPTVKFVLSSYEYLSVVHRRMLQQIFNVPVFDLYGSTETGHLLMEVEPGLMAPSQATAYLEILTPGLQDVGRLVVTTLTNDFMPLIRYDIGDLARRKVVENEFRYELHGRVRDALQDTHGRRVTVRQVDECLTNVEGILHYQLHQTDAGSYVWTYAAMDVPPTEDALAQFKDRLQALMDAPGGVQLGASEVISCEPSGKFRLCHPMAA
jgi:phenylacetate-CoA ligase